MGHQRSSSSDSDSSSSSRDSGSQHKHKGKKDKKDKKEKKHEKEKDKHHVSPGHGAPAFPSAHQPASVPWFPAPAPLQPHSQVSPLSDAHTVRASSPQPPPNYQRPPPSGFRIPLTTDAVFPPYEQAGRPPCVDADGISPVYFGSAIFPNAVHPCKVAPHLAPTPCRVAYGGTEQEHSGRYDLLPFTQDMELIRASDGRVPPGRHPVEGGYEESNGRNQKLYHAVATINGVRVSGKCGEHLMGANVPFGGAEVCVREYELLVWKY